MPYRFVHAADIHLDRNWPLIERQYRGAREKMTILVLDSHKKDALSQFVLHTLEAKLPRKAKKARRGAKS